MSYGILFLLITLGLVGPLLAGMRRLTVPMIFGEILAGVIAGKTGFNWLPTEDPTLVFLSMFGLAMLQFLVGTRLPLSDPSLRKDIKRGIWATVLGFVIAIPLGVLFARYAGFGQWAMFAVMFSASSAAIVLPIVYERKLTGPVLMHTVSWVVAADMATVMGLSVAMSTGQAAVAILGSFLVIAVAIGATVFLKRFYQHHLGAYYRQQSRERDWALDLRVSLAVLLGLCWLAEAFGASILIAGFAAGAVVAAVDMPKRLTKQLIGLGEGFFVPLFFVDLGAKLDFRALFSSPNYIVVAVLLWLAALTVHLVVSKLMGLPVASGMIATAQKGVSAAVVSLGLASGALNAGQGAAIITAMLLALLTCSVGANRLNHSGASGTAEGAPPPGNPRG